MHIKHTHNTHAHTHARAYTHYAIHTITSIHITNEPTLVKTTQFINKSFLEKTRPTMRYHL